jgi:uncharacterized membrane protein
MDEARMTLPSRHQPTVRATHRNIEAVLQLEREAAQRLGRSERIGTWIIQRIGRLRFVVAHLVLAAAWIAINLGGVPGLEPFDPFPFGMFTLVVTTEGVCLALFILIAQNAMDRQADRRAHLTQQISLLAETETTKVLQLLRAIAERNGVVVKDEELVHLSETTEVETLARDIERKLDRPGD